METAPSVNASRGGLPCESDRRLRGLIYLTLISPVRGSGTTFQLPCVWWRTLDTLGECWKRFVRLRLQRFVTLLLIAGYK